MSIQFRCGCGRSIEVDDDLADMEVRCPFCESVLRAPSASSLPPTPPPPAAREARPPSAWGVLALTFAVLTAACVGLAIVVMATAVLRELGPRDASDQPSQGEIQRATETVLERFVTQGWFLALSCAMPVLATLGLGCGLASLRAGARWQGATALIVCGAVATCVVGSFILRAAGVQPGP